MVSSACLQLENPSWHVLRLQFRNAGQDSGGSGAPPAQAVLASEREEPEMRERRFVASVVVAAGLVGGMAVMAAVALPGSTTASAPDTEQGPVVAAASGGSADALVFPSVVAVHLDRSQAAISRAEAAVDKGVGTARAVEHMTVATTQMIEAWQATRFLIRTTPPPPPPSGRAGASGGAAAGPSFASPPDTSLAVFTLQHDLVAAAAGLLGGDVTLDSALTDAMSETASQRTAAIKFIHRVAPPPPPGDRAGASGGAIAPTFDATMPGVLPLLDDEIKALRGAVVLNAELPASVQTDVKAVIASDKEAKTAINTFWPPIVGDG